MLGIITLLGLVSLLRWVMLNQRCWLILDFCGAFIIEFLLRWAQFVWQCVVKGLFSKFVYIYLWQSQIMLLFVTFEKSLENSWLLAMHPLNYRNVFHVHSLDLPRMSEYYPLRTTWAGIFQNEPYSMEVYALSNFRWPLKKATSDACAFSFTSKLSIVDLIPQRMSRLLEPSDL